MAKAADDPLLDLIGRTYDAALDATLWPGVGLRIGRAFSSPSAGLYVQRPGETPQWLVQTSNLAAGGDAYDAYYYKRDIWAQRVAQIEMARIFTNQELISEVDFVRTEFYGDWCHKVDIFHLVGTVFEVSDGNISVLGLHRPNSAKAYSDDDKDRLGRLFPHLKRAVQLHQRLSTASIEGRASLDTVERTGVATFVVGRDGHILYANALAEGLLRQGDAIRGIGGRVVAIDRIAAEKLAMAIAGAVDAATGKSASVSPALAIMREDRLPLTLMAAPLRPATNGFGAAVPAAIVFIRDPEQPTPSSRMLRGLFGLTAAEASVAAALADGLPLDVIAASHRVSLNTARTHLKNILAKTGTRRQAELVALVLRSVATMEPDQPARIP